MKHYIAICLITALSLLSCQRKKDTQNEIATSPALTKVLLQKSIDSAIAVDDRRLDIKMKRKFFEPKKGDMITYQKFFDKGDTTKLLKLREEILYGDSKMEVIQYHFLNNKLVEIHDYEYNKKCGDKEKQCMIESKYFFEDEEFSSALTRKAEGDNKNLPTIEKSNFETFIPKEDNVRNKKENIEIINKKYALLPYPKQKN
jgi:hypothetical protein